jgi:hemophore
MKTTAAMRHRRLFAGLLAAAAPGVACAVLAGPAATGANDPCAASEVARTIGSVSKSIGDYLDAHPETNQTMTAMLQQQGGPESMKSYFAANPKVAADMGSITQPLTSVSTQCKLPISIPQAMGLMQQGAGGVPPSGPPALAPGSAAASPVRAGLGNSPAPPAPAGPLPGPSRQNNVG